MKSGQKGTRSGFWTDTSGSSALELAVLVPTLLLMIFSILSLGLVFNNYLELTNGVRGAAREFALSRGSSTPVTNATNVITGSTTTTPAVAAAAPNLTLSSLTLKYYVNGTACTTDAGCSALLSPSTGSVIGDPAEITASYPCTIIIMGVNYAPSGCTLSAQSSEDIE